MVLAACQAPTVWGTPIWAPSGIMLSVSRLHQDWQHASTAVATVPDDAHVDTDSTRQFHVGLLGALQL